MTGMVSRSLVVLITIVALAASACSNVSATGGPITGQSGTLTVSGEFQPVVLDAVQRVSIDGSRLVLHGTVGTAAVELPTNADPAQTNRGWALVTEGENGDTRTLTFTHEMSLDDFTLALPASAAPLKYGSFAGRDGADMLVFAWGADSQCYWGWVSIRKLSAAAQ